MLLLLQNIHVLHEAYNKPIACLSFFCAQEGEQKLLMIFILDAYNRIFTRMENETQDEKLKHDLHKVKEQMNKLKAHYFSGKHANIEKYVTELLALKVSPVMLMIPNSKHILEKSCRQIGNTCLFLGKEVGLSMKL